MSASGKSLTCEKGTNVILARLVPSVRRPWSGHDHAQLKRRLRAMRGLRRGHYEIAADEFVGACCCLRPPGQSHLTARPDQPACQARLVIEQRNRSDDLKRRAAKPQSGLIGDIRVEQLGQLSGKRAQLLIAVHARQLVEQPGHDLGLGDRQRRLRFCGQTTLAEHSA